MIAQIYETTLVQRHNRLSLKVIFMPKRSIPEISKFGSKVDIDYFRKVASERLALYSQKKSDIRELRANLKRFIITEYEKKDEFYAAEPGLEYEESGSVMYSDIGNVFNLEAEIESEEILRELFDRKVIPFENSPLSGESLSNLIKTGGGTGIGAWVGLAVSDGSHIALILVPAGMIICGAAAGLGDGLYKKLRSWAAGE